MNDDRYRDGQWRDAASLPAPMKRLHRKIARATRAAREQQRLPSTATGDERKWPGLINPSKENTHA